MVGMCVAVFFFMTFSFPTMILGVLLKVAVESVELDGDIGASLHLRPPNTWGKLQDKLHLTF